MKGKDEKTKKNYGKIKKRRKIVSNEVIKRKQ